MQGHSGGLISGGAVFAGAHFSISISKAWRTDTRVQKTYHSIVKMSVLRIAKVKGCTEGWTHFNIITHHDHTFTFHKTAYKLGSATTKIESSHVH